MSTTYDVVIVGAGPAGLMAAKTLAEENVRVALVEKRKDLTDWRRADCMMFFGLEGDFLGEDIKVEVGGVRFPRNGFEVTYTGGLYPLYQKRSFSPGGHRIDYGGECPVAILFDKGILLRDLLRKAEEQGVTVFSGTLGIGAENTKEGARVQIKGKKGKAWLNTKKVIAADGLNSQITERIGLNKERPSVGLFKVLQYILEEVENPYPNSWMQFFGKTLSPLIPLHFHQTVHGESIHKLGAVRFAPGNPEEDLKKVMEDSYFAPWFKKAKIVGKMGASFKGFMPIKEPVVGNVLVIGDAADSGEVENQGALMCGYHAGKALLKELAGQKGIDAYCKWWQESFEFFSPEIHRVAQGNAINPHYEDEEIDYLFSLVEGTTLEGTIVQYKTPRLLWDAIFKHKDRIQKERPELIERIENVRKLTLEEAFTTKG